MKRSINSRFKSFSYAFNGLKILFREEPNGRIHLILAGTAVLCGFLFKITPIEWIAIVLVIGLVFSFELLNTSIEQLADFVSPGKHEMIKRIKDLAAAGVLVGAVTALLTGLIIFLPRVLKLVF